MKSPKLILLVVMMSFPFSISPVTKTLKRASSWAISAGPLWLEVYNYLSLLFDQQALNLFGDENLPQEQEAFIRETLKNLEFKDWETIIIKKIKQDMQGYIQNAIVCTDSVIFINSYFYSDLTEKEREAVIAHAMVMIQEHHTLTNAVVLATVPFVTHLATDFYLKVVDKIVPDFIKANWFGANLLSAHNFFASNCITKLIMNTILASRYFKARARHYDITSALKAGSAQDLANYYAKIHKRSPAHDGLLAFCQPTLQERINYLNALSKSN